MIEVGWSFQQLATKLVMHKNRLDYDVYSTLDLRGHQEVENIGNSNANKLSTLYAREPKEIKLLGALLQFIKKMIDRYLQNELDLSTLTQTQIDALIEKCLSLAVILQQIVIEDIEGKLTFNGKLTLVNIGNPDSDFELMGTLSPEERAAQSMKRAEKNGEVIDLCNL